VVVNLPTYEKNPLKRLRLSQEDYNRVKRSTLPIVSFYGMGLLGWYPSGISRFLSKSHLIPSGLTSFPGGLEHLSLQEYRGIDALGFAGMLEGSAGKSFTETDSSLISFQM